VAVAQWGRPSIIENRTGAAAYRRRGSLPREPDGYTLLASPPPPLVINQSLYPKLGFRSETLRTGHRHGAGAQCAVVNPDKVKASSVAELVAYLREHPDKLVCATQGIGTTSHLTSEMFKLVGNVKLRDIPYRGSAPALQACSAARSIWMFDNLRRLLAAGRGRQAEAAGGASPAACLPCRTCRTVAESMPGF